MKTWSACTRLVRLVGGALWLLWAPGAHAQSANRATSPASETTVTAMVAPTVTTTVAATPDATPDAAPDAIGNATVRPSRPLIPGGWLAVSEPRPAAVVRPSAAVRGSGNAQLSAALARYPTSLLADAISTTASMDGFGTPVSARWQQKSAPAPWFAPLASLLVPGSGQGILRQQRSVAYAVAEAFLVIRSLQAYRDDQHARERYRALAADVARLSFGSVRPDGPWEYYEEMEKYEASGAYSTGVLGPIIPESDPTTFNGKQWELARQQFWADPSVTPPLDAPEYLRALDFYKKRAVQGSFLWSWRDHQLEHTAFRETIRESNNSNQRYVTSIGFVGVNHLVSLVDAYVTVRLRRYGGAGLSAASLNTKVVPMGVGSDRGYGMIMNVTIPVAARR